MAYLPSGDATVPTLQFNWIKVYLAQLACRHHLVGCLVEFNEPPLFPNVATLSISV